MQYRSVVLSAAFYRADDDARYSTNQIIKELVSREYLNTGATLLGNRIKVSTFSF